MSFSTESRAVSAGNRPRAKYAFNQPDSTLALPAHQTDFLPITCNFDRSKYQQQSGRHEEPHGEAFTFLVSAYHRFIHTVPGRAPRKRKFIVHFYVGILVICMRTA